MTPSRPSAKQLDRIESRLDELYDIMVGDPKNDKPGLVERVRKLEDEHVNQKEGRRLWLAPLIGSVVSGLVGAAVTIFTLYARFLPVLQQIEQLDLTSRKGP